MKYYLFDHAGCHNRGSEAIIRGTVNIITRTDKAAAFKLASHRPENDEILGMETVKIESGELTNMQRAVAKLSLKINHNEKYALKKMYSSVIDGAEDCDVVLAVGGDTYCYGDNSSTRAIIEKLNKKGKKVILWGASIGEDDLSPEKIEAFKDFSGVFSREPVTYRILKKYVSSEKLFMFSDPAFCMEREDLPLPEGFVQNGTLGFNLSPLVCSKNSKLFDASVDFLKYIINNTTLQIALIPHVIEDGNNDCEVLEEIYKKLNNPRRVVMIPDGLGAMQYKGYIARCRFFIGARTHATIAAYSNGVPTIVLGYSVKSKGISEDLFGKVKYVLDSSEIDSADALIEEFNSLLKEEDEIKSVLKASVPEKLKSAMNAGIQLSKM